MKIINLRDGTIHWRIFNWDDSLALSNSFLRADKANGDTPPRGSFEYNDGVGEFLLEVQEKSTGTTFYWPSLHFNNEVLSVVDSSGAVRAFVTKRLTVDTPVDGSQLANTRLGVDTDWAAVTLQLGDAGALEAVADNTDVFVLVQQPGQADVAATARVDLMENHWPDKLVFTKTPLELRHSGTTFLTALLGAPPNSRVKSVPKTTVTVLPTEARRYRIALNGTAGPTPEIDAPLAASLLHVELWGVSPGVYTNVRVQTSLDGFATTTPATFIRVEIENGQPVPKFEAWITVAQLRAPGTYQLKIFDKDFFGFEAAPAVFTFTTTDKHPPKITIDTPTEDQPFVTSTLPLAVHVSGSVIDTQTGYATGTLKFDFGDQSDVSVQVDASGKWSFTLQAKDYGPYIVTIRAQDQAVPPNKAQESREFKVVRVLQVETFDDLLSTRAYLGELLRLVRTRIVNAGNAGVNSDQLSTAFVQPFGTLAQPGNPLAGQVTSDLLLPVRLLRAALGSTAAAGALPGALAGYLRKAYEALLRGVGTSFEELRGLSMLPASSRQALAERLGLRTANGDDLQLLIDPYYQVVIGAPGAGAAPPPQVAVRSYTRRGKVVRGHVRAKGDHSLANNFGPSRTTAELTQPLTRDADRDGVPNYADPNDDNDRILDDADPSQYAPNHGTEEAWLKDTFGLPSTADPVAIVPVAAQVPALLRAQRSALAQGWQRTDAAALRWPDLDPDLVDADDLAASAPAWRQLLQTRAAQLEAKFSALVSTVLAADALSAVLTQQLRQTLLDLAQRDRAGESITEAVTALKLDMPMFRRMVSYIGLVDAGTLLSGFEREDLAHLLVEAWKRWTLLDAWWGVEVKGMATKLWPTLAGDGAWVVGGGFRRDFLPWRGTAARRQALEARLAVRWRAWNELSDALGRAVFDAQRAALPLLRDRLISLFNPPVTNRDDLTERWLVDVESMGVALISPIKQAVSSVQTLVNGVRGGWFGPGHPAEKWKLKSTLAAAFDDEWKWLLTEEQWRAAVMNYIYPENVLFPELRTTSSDAFNKFLAKLRAQQPLTKDSADALELTALSGDEREYFAPVAIGLALQRAGLHSLALDYYREVYEIARPVAKDAANPDNQRKRAALLRSEDDTLAPSPNFDDDSWTRMLSDPHNVAVATTTTGLRIFGNPYTRFTLMQISRCILASADAEFASGTIDGLTKARGLYLEAKAALSLPELIDQTPAAPGQVKVVNPAMLALRGHVVASLLKLRNGLSILGTPLPPDLTRMDGGGTLSSLVRPTPYRFKVLIERAKQLVAIAQQFEAQYLSAIERNEAELEKALREGFAAQIAAQTVTLREAGLTEAENGKTLALAQQTRSQIEHDRYESWISEGENEYERQQMDAMHAAADFRQVANVAQTAAAVATSVGQAIGGWKDAGASSVAYGAAAAAQTVGGIAQGFAIARESDVQFAGLYASQQRRTDEWQLRADIADQDVRIGGTQVTLAGDRLAIATQELAIANTSSDQAQQMLSFLRTKFTSAAFYDWLTGVLSETYAFFLRLAAATAQQAELQLAFERQEQPRRLVRGDYWAAASQSSSADAPDRRGITGSARLLQDLYTLDQQAFSSERRLLNLTQSFSLARLLPVEFETLRRTGQLIFATPALWFDEGFPGHYMRLVKRVRLSVAALITPTSGIRATLASSGMSRVVTADLGFPTMVIRQDPQSVALTSPLSSSGVFELDTQSDLLQPFEGMGVDATWSLEISRAGNSFDFDSLTDVVVSIDYTALSSPDLRDRVVKALSRSYVADRVVSVRRDLPDVWYQLLNGTDNPARVLVGMSTRAFPPGLDNLRIEGLAVSARTTGGTPARFDAKLLLPSAAGPLVAAGTLVSIAGLASSRQSGGVSWQSAISASPAIGTESNSWALDFTDAPGGGAGEEAFLVQLRAGSVDDILVALTFSADRRPW